MRDVPDHDRRVAGVLGAWIHAAARSEVAEPSVLQLDVHAGERDARLAREHAQEEPRGNDRTALGRHRRARVRQRNSIRERLRRRADVGSPARLRCRALVTRRAATARALTTEQRDRGGRAQYEHASEREQRASPHGA